MQMDLKCTASHHLGRASPPRSCKSPRSQRVDQNSLDYEQSLQDVCQDRKTVQGKVDRPSLRKYYQGSMEPWGRILITFSLLATQQQVEPHFWAFPRQVRLFPWRSINSVKNRFFSLARKSLRKMCHFTSSTAKDLNVYSIKSSTFTYIFQETIPADVLKAPQFLHEGWSK